LTTMDYKYSPKTKKELTDAIRAEIKLQGSRANLNCIDTSAITNMYELFSKFRTFDGDISRWDVSHVTNMARMFAESQFNGDISLWDVSRVEDMTGMFNSSRFKGDISRWNVGNVASYHPMFHYCHIPEERKPLRFQKRAIGCDDFLSILSRLLDGIADIASAAEKILSECHLVKERSDGAPKDALIYRLADGSVMVRFSKGKGSFKKYRGIVDEGEYEFIDGKCFKYTVTGDGVCTVSGDLDGKRESWYSGRGMYLGTESFFDRLVVAEGVTRIGDNVFEDWDSIREVSLPKSLLEIGIRSFCGCSNLTTLRFSTGLVKIGNSAFYGCSKLTEVKFPRTLQAIGEYAFTGCRSLETIIFPPKMESIGKEAFCRCDKLSGVEVPKSVQHLASNAFESLSFDIGPLTFTVENYAASGTTARVGSVDDEVSGDIVIPSEMEYEGKVIRVTALNDYAFGGCKELKEVWIPDGIEVIPMEAFSGCKRLRRVHFGNGVRVIERRAFYRCSRLREVELPNSIEAIDEYAFQECGNLLLVNRPDALKELRCNAFDNSSVMDFGPGARYFVDILMGFDGYMPTSTVLEVRKGTTLVAASALSGSNLSGVILPSTIKYIGERGFNNGRPIVVEAPWKKPIPVGERAFGSKSTILVPKGCLERYKGNPAWNNYNLEEK